MYRILTEPVSNLIRQQVELMRSEEVSLVFTEGAIREIARVAFLVSACQHLRCISQASDRSVPVGRGWGALAHFYRLCVLTYALMYW